MSMVYEELFQIIVFDCDCHRSKSKPNEYAPNEAKQVRFSSYQNRRKRFIHEEKGRAINQVE